MEMFKRKSLFRWHRMDPLWVPQNQVRCGADVTARPTKGIISNLINTQSDFLGWQSVDILEPQTSGGGLYSNMYKIGFSTEEGGFAMRCSLSLQGRIGVLIGPDPVSFFIVESEADASLVVLGRTSRGILDKDILLI